MTRFAAALLAMMSSGWQTGEAFNIDVPRPGIVESLDPIWREHQIEIERAVAELDEVLAQLDLMALRLGEGKAEIAERRDDGPPRSLDIF